MKNIIIYLVFFLNIAALGSFSYAQSVQMRNIKGVIKSDSNEPLSGVTVTVKGSQISASSDEKGLFSISVPVSAGTLSFSFIGFATQEKQLGSSEGPLTIVLKHEQNNLSEVVVTGYTAQRKKDIIGAVTVVDTKELLATPAGNVTTALQGRAPGITVGGDGTPGGVAKVRVRGFGSFGGSDPLYIIDGVPTTSGIDNLNPNDIESLQVLKDAAAASVYGSRAANGVVIITTKKGKSGENKISFDGYTGFSFNSTSQYPKMLDAVQYGDLYWMQMKGAGLKQGDLSWGHPQYGYGEFPMIPEYVYVNNNGIPYGGAQLEILKNSNPTLYNSLINPDNYNFKTHQIVKAGNTNWFNEIFNPALQQNYQLNVSGGSAKGRFSTGFNFFDQKSPANKESYYKRYSLRVNSSYDVGKYVTIGENLQVGATNSNRFKTPLNNGTNITSAYLSHPLIPVYDIFNNPAGSAGPGLGGAIIDGAGTNPVTEPYKHRFDRTLGYPIFGNAFIDVKFLKELTFHSSFGMDYLTTSARLFNPTSVEYAQNNTTNSLTVLNENSNTWTWTNTLNYNKKFGDKHNLTALLGYEAIKTYSEHTSSQRLNYAVEDDPNFMVLDAGTGTQTNSGYFRRSSLVSQFARIDYSLADRYLLGFTVRRDQSSRFSDNNRTGYFPAAALGWRVSEENFLKDLKWINDLKLRVSWGIIGNQNGLNNENRYTVYRQDLNNGYPINASNSSQLNAYVLSRLGNNNAKWEKNTTTNIGLDGTFFDRKLDLSIEVYNKATSGLLVPEQLPLTGVDISDLNLSYVNSGNIRNRGIDLGITYKGNFSESFKYSTSLTFSKFSNRVMEILDNKDATILSGNTRIGNVSISQVGYPIASFYGYQTDGFINNATELAEYRSKISSTWLPPEIGRWKIKDVNGDGIINAADKVILGSPLPKFQMGANIALSYKNFDFTGFLFWSYGAKIYNQSRWFTDFNNYGFNRSLRMLKDSWTPELGNNALLPKLDLNDTYSSSNVTDYFVEDASFLRLKTAQLGYTFSDRMAKKLHLEKLRFYIQGQNLFTVTKYTGMDPDGNFYSGGTGEASSTDLSMGIQFGALPAPKQIIFGVNVGF